MARYGEIPGVEVGALFPNRAALSLSGVHRPRQAGICGTSKAGGAESIVLNGGYEDDEDFGDVIVYTGHGGNDPATGRQVGDQVLSPGNAALAESCASGNPVRVIRGPKTDPPHAPEQGYRYDGLYRVEEWWWEPGRSGFLVFRCRLASIIPDGAEDDQSAPPPNLFPFVVREAPLRIEQVTQRIVRSTEVCAKVKQIYNFACQRCGTSIVAGESRYAECAHIIPLGRPHNGSDDISNVLCLCPNCHVEFDLLGWHLTDDLVIVPDGRSLSVNRRHVLSASSISYRRRMATGRS
jgi:putative restriction endonuclease